MGLFDKFRKKIHKAVEEVDVDTLTAGKEEAEQTVNTPDPPAEEEWEDLDEEEPLVLKPDESDSEWD